MPQRSAYATGHRLRRRHTRNNTHRHLTPLRIICDFQHRCSHGKHTGIPGGHHRYSTPAFGHIQRHGRPLSLHLVIRKVPALPSPFRHAVDVGGVAHNIGRPSQFSHHFRRGPLIGTWTKPHNHNFALVFLRNTSPHRR